MIPYTCDRCTFPPCGVATREVSSLTGEDGQGSTPGIDVPDSRGRTGLDRAGRDLAGNPDVVVRDVELLASGWHVLRRTTLERRRTDGE